METFYFIGVSGVARDGETGTFYFIGFSRVATVAGWHAPHEHQRGGCVYHVLNRGNARQPVFHNDGTRELGLESSLRPRGRPKK